MQELVTWKRLTGDGRLSDAMAEGAGCAPVGRQGTHPPVPGAVADKEGRGGLGEEEPAEVFNIYYWGLGGS